MATRTSHKLTDRAIKSKKEPGRYADGGGLYLQIGPSGTKAWLFRFMRGGNARQMGLGALDVVSLQEARAAVLACRKLLHQGLDPIESRREGRLKALLDTSRSMSFRECADAYITAHRAGWKNAKHGAQWQSTLETYCFPVLGALPVSGIETGHVLKVLEGEFWLTKTETATRVRGRMEKILDWAGARGYREGPNPARWQGHLDKLLPRPAKVKKVEHFAAIPHPEVSAFYKALGREQSVSARALQFIILTATRTKEVLGAKWLEIDLASRVWTVPASRMKAGKEHRVPLSDAAMAILSGLPRMADSDYVFPGAQSRKPLSNMACLALLRRMNRTDLTVHGFRSTFRDWAAETTNFSREVAEMALAHTIREKVEAAYRRGDLMDKRRAMMQQWADYCVGKYAGKVQSIGKKKAA